MNRKNYIFAVACNSHGIATLWAGSTKHVKHWVRAHTHGFDIKQFPADIYHTMATINKYINKYTLEKVGENAYKTQKGNVAVVFHRDELPLFLAEAKLKRNA